MIVSTIMCFVIIAAPANDALVSIALYSVVASAFFYTKPIGIML
jgi:hypothetical protein